LPIESAHILSRSFAEQLTGEDDPASAARQLSTKGRRVVVVTCGAHGCWYLESKARGSLCHQPAFEVKTVDTTGCGDVFHGAYASALARGMPLKARIRFASAAAALKATRPGGQNGIPTRAIVEKFLRERSHAS
jgi:sulfofructose kinase